LARRWPWMEILQAWRCLNRQWRSSKNGLPADPSDYFRRFFFIAIMKKLEKLGSAAPQICFIHWRLDR
jgi:hypothetical protein